MQDLTLGLPHKPVTKSVTVSDVVLPVSIWKQLEDAAVATERTLGEAVALIIMQHVERCQQPPEDAPRRRRAPKRQVRAIAA